MPWQRAPPNICRYQVSVTSTSTVIKVELLSLFYYIMVSPRVIVNSIVVELSRRQCWNDTAWLKSILCTKWHALNNQIQLLDIHHGIAQQNNVLFTAVFASSGGHSHIFCSYGCGFWHHTLVSLLQSCDICHYVSHHVADAWLEQVT